VKLWRRWNNRKEIRTVVLSFKSFEMLGEMTMQQAKG